MTLTLNPNYYIEMYDGAILHWFDFEDTLKEDYAITTATVAQLRKLNVATSKAVVDWHLGNQGYVAVYKNFIRRCDETTVINYLKEHEQKKLVKAQKKMYKIVLDVFNDAIKLLEEVEDYESCRKLSSYLKTVKQ